MECTNGDQTVSYPNYKVTQIRDCATSLGLAAAPTNPVLIYNTVTTTQSVGDWTTFFTNADNANCPVTTCALKT